jgi:hypothetical protein
MPNKGRQIIEGNQHNPMIFYQLTEHGNAKSRLSDAKRWFMKMCG